MIPRSSSWCSSLFLVAGACTSPVEAPLPAADVVAHSIAYHDPDGRWLDDAATLEILLHRPSEDGTTATSRSTVSFDRSRQTFTVQRVVDGHDVEWKSVAGERVGRIDGDAELTDEQRKRHSLDRDGITRRRDYHDYMFGLPMKLRDPGTIIAEPARRAKFGARDVVAVDVGYPDEIGRDRWTFYFDPTRYACVGCEFVHLDRDGGERIAFEGEVTGANLRLPKWRRWYRSDDNAYLGGDEVIAIEPSVR